MGLGGISIWQLLIVLAIVIMLFGTKRLRGLGSDLGSAIKGFKKSMQDDEAAPEQDDDTAESESTAARRESDDALTDSSENGSAQSAEREKTRSS